MAAQFVECLDVREDREFGSVEAWETRIAQIESELYSSRIYQQVVTALQVRLGELANTTQALIEIVSREAIHLTLSRLTQPDQETTSQLSPTKIHSHVTGQPSTSLMLSSTDLTQATKLPEAVPESCQPLDSTFASKASISKQTHKFTQNTSRPEPVAQGREEYLQHLGTHLKQLRLAYPLSLQQLHNITFVPLHQLEAIEAGQVDRLPEDVYIRGFIRRIGNALGLDGDSLAASLPKSDSAERVVPSWHQNHSQAGFQLRPVHLYVGYAALMAGAVSGLTLLSQQSGPGSSVAPVQIAPSQTSITQSSREQAATHIPGLKASRGGVVAGQDIAPPENFSSAK